MIGAEQTGVRGQRGGVIVLVRVQGVARQAVVLEAQREQTRDDRRAAQVDARQRVVFLQRYKGGPRVLGDRDVFRFKIL